MSLPSIKLSTTFTFDPVYYHCSLAFSLVDAGTIDFVRILTVAYFGGGNFIEDAFHHFLVNIHKQHFLQIQMTLVYHPHTQPFQPKLISKLIYAFVFWFVPLATISGHKVG